jgi:hypothetical protein
MTNPIDSETGLPALLPNQFWRVERTRDYYDNRTHKVLIIETLIPKASTLFADFFRSKKNKRAVREHEIASEYIGRSIGFSAYDDAGSWEVDGDTFKHGDGWEAKVSEALKLAEEKKAEWGGSAKISKSERNDRTHFEVYDYEISSASILRTAEEIIEKRERYAETRRIEEEKKAALAKFEGDYPPKKLGA